MTRVALAGVIGLVLLAVAVLQPSPVQTLAQGQPPAGTRHTGKAFRFNQVKEGVYHAVGTGALAVVGNSAVIVNDNDVIIVDDHVSPAAAWVLLDEMKSSPASRCGPSSTPTSTSTTRTAIRCSAGTWTSSATSSRATCC